MAPVTVEVKTVPHQIVQKVYLAYVFVRLGFKPRNNQHIAIFHSVAQTGKSRPLTGGNGATDMLLDQSLGFDGKTGCFDFPALVLRVLLQCGNTAVGKNA